MENNVSSQSTQMPTSKLLVVKEQHVKMDPRIYVLVEFELAMNTT